MQASSVQQGSMSEKSAISSMTEIYDSTSKMTEVDKLLILYYVYDKSNQLYLQSLHSLGAAIISQQQLTPNANTKADQDDDDAPKIKYYSNTVEEIKKASIKISYIKMDRNSKEQDKYNIRIYESGVSKQRVRVVTLPIDKNIIDLTSINSINDKIKNMEQSSHTHIRKNLLKRQQLEEYQQKCAKEMSDFRQQQYANMTPRHEKMFNIEAFIQIIRKKAAKGKVSIGAFASYGQFNKSKPREQLLRIFNIPPGSQKNEGQQLIIHAVGSKNNADTLMNLKQQVSCIYTHIKQKAECLKNQCFNDIYYSNKPLEFSTKIYSLINEARNQFAASIIQEFCKNWNNIASAACTCIAYTLKAVYAELDYGELSSSNILAQTTLYTFEQIFKKYEDQKMKKYLTTNTKIAPFYSKNELAKNPFEKGVQRSQYIQLISFVYFFEQINNDFLEKYAEKQKKDSKQLYEFVLNYLRTVCELIHQTTIPNVNTEHVQTYYNFLEFLFDSSLLVRSITGRDLPICGSIKAMFDQLKPKENRMVSYILSHPQRIEPDRAVHQYNLLLRILKEGSKSKDSKQNKIDFIYLRLHQYKADKIAKEQSYIKSKVVQAIKSYSQIIHQYPKLPESQRQEINKLQIQKKIARLLLIAELPEEALAIFKKNHLIKSVEKCFKQILMSYQGNNKAQKYIEFGQYFQNQFSYYKAIDYYESAFEVAKSTEMRQQSLKRKMQCLRNMANPKTDNNLYSRFIDNVCTQDQFLGALKKEKEEKTIFTQLRNKLKWSEVDSKAIMNEDKSIDESMIE